MGRTRKPEPQEQKCSFCHVQLTKAEKPYSSRQAGMAGVYHWACFIEACKNRVPVSIGSFEAPTSGGGDAEEREVESAPATVEE
jgi:hypothetical protein